MNESGWLVLGFILIPFAIGSLWHVFGAWLGLPALMVGGVFWIGILDSLHKK